MLPHILAFATLWSLGTEARGGFILCQVTWHFRHIEVALKVCHLPTTFLIYAWKQGSTTQSACEGWLCQASGVLATTCLPSRLSRAFILSSTPHCLCNHPRRSFLPWAMSYTRKEKEPQPTKIAALFSSCAGPRKQLTPCVFPFTFDSPLKLGVGQNQFHARWCAGERMGHCWRIAVSSGWGAFPESWKGL